MFITQVTNWDCKTKFTNIYLQKQNNVSLLGFSILGIFWQQGRESLKAWKKEAVTELTVHCFNIYGTSENNELMYVCLSFCTITQVVNFSTSMNFCESSAGSGRHFWIIKWLEFGGEG